MPYYDYYCKEHGKFERFLPAYQATHACPRCEASCEQRWFRFPNMEASAFAQWNAPVDPAFGGKVFTDRHKYYEAIDKSGRYIKEAGFDDDAKRNEQYYLEKEEKRVFDKLDTHLRDLGSDEIQKRLAVDVQIHDATMRGDENAIRRMGGMTSVDEAYSAAQDTQINVTPTRRANAGRQ